MTLVVGNEDVEQVLTLDDCFEVVETAYREMAEGRAVNRARSHTYLPTSRPDVAYCLKSMEGGVASLGVMALRLSSDHVAERVVAGLRRRDKLPSASGERYLGLILLFSTETLELLAVLHDGVIQKLRVGVTTALAMRHLARTDARTLGLFGSGWQASAHLPALCRVRDFREVRVYSPTVEHQRRFADEMTRTVGVPVRAVDGPREVVEGADCVVATTNASRPVFDGAWLAPGTFVASIVGGDHVRPRWELDDTTIRRADRIVVNSREHLRAARQRDLLDPLEAGALRWEMIGELAEVIAGKVPGRTRPEEITLFKNNVGLGIQFAAVGARVLELCRAKGRGREIPSEWFLQTVHP
jgi:ornithine cyclodeaminase/alanine dehydrogenase-like protein (mu-crystallin family)